REDADAFALRSHQNALRAQDSGSFAEEIVPVEVETMLPGKTEKTVFQKDEGPRADTSLEALAKLKPVFHAAGTVTAGNSYKIGVIELNEAFAVQALAVIREAGLDPERINLNGGAIALGHPLGCTGAKLTATILRELARRKAKYGMVTMCVGGGQGAAGIFEWLQ